MIDKLKKELKESYRMEMLGAGIYKGLSNQYSKRDADLSRKFLKFSRQEAMHGRLFKEYFSEQSFGQLRSGFFWRFIGRLAATLMRPLPLSKKLKKIQVAEQHAVYSIEKKLIEDLDQGYRKIIELILPHEEAHAALYGELFSD